ncbi:hypothetical protein TEA_027281 [Camellia sinensis var. sinensis]|uniref:Uncharacterized protein n=1 Tax=Camellia sinensis var. sinensis TaxID=542762 RepID=A0A4V3WJ87_CAMSN|nr:hypothetical protein TEA_027281 [Camellia sinensis var. sinensis]
MIVREEVKLISKMWLWFCPKICRYNTDSRLWELVGPPDWASGMFSSVSSAANQKIWAKCTKLALTVTGNCHKKIPLVSNLGRRRAHHMGSNSKSVVNFIEAGHERFGTLISSYYRGAYGIILVFHMDGIVL